MLQQFSMSNKKSGEPRGVLDSRVLKRITKVNSTLLRSSGEVLDRLDKATVFSKIDMRT